MDSNLYKAAMSGKVELLEEVARTNPQLLVSEAPQKNTALHIAAKLGHDSFVKKMLELCSQLLELRNSQGDTPLHCAARAGRLEVVKSLVKNYAEGAGRLEVVQIQVEHYDPEMPKSSSPKSDADPAPEAEAQNEEAGLEPWFLDAEVGEGCFERETAKRPRAPPTQWPSLKTLSSVGYLRTPNNEWDTALHEALRNRHMNVAIKLLESDRGLVSITNFAKESPLHLAVKEDLQKVAEMILSVSSSDNAGEASKSSDAILERNRKQLVALKDYTGRTALHYAMWRNNAAAVEIILGIDSQVVPYSTDDEGFSPLHVAAAFGSRTAIYRLIERCPDTMEQLDKKGRNLFHIAVLNHKLLSIKRLGIPNAGEMLNERDEDGNTPLHLAAKYYNAMSFYRLAREDEKVDLTLMNHLGQTALYLSEFGIFLLKVFVRPTAPSRRMRKMRSVICEERLKKFDRNEKRKEQENKEGTYMTIATLIATVTFAAGIAVPGGFRSSDEHKPGTATLVHQFGFQVFMIFDTISMWLSIAAIVCYLLEWKPQFGIRSSLLLSNFLTMMACIFMLLAFGTGVYVIVSPRCRWLAVLICFICSVFPYLYVAGSVSIKCWLVLNGPRLEAKTQRALLLPEEEDDSLV